MKNLVTHVRGLDSCHPCDSDHGVFKPADSTTRSLALESQNIIWTPGKGIKIKKNYS